MTRRKYDVLKQVVEPQPFIPASVLARLTPEERETLFLAMYEMKREQEDGSVAMVARNSTYGQSAWVEDDSI